MPTIAVLPTPLARRAIAPSNPRNALTCGIFDIAGRLGQAHRSPAYICRTIDKLIEGEGFPAPYPVIVRGRLASDVHKDSRWPRVAIDAWFDDRLPPAARDAIDTAERVQIDSRLAGRAAALFAGEVA